MNLPEVHRLEVIPGVVAEMRMLRHRGVLLSWSSGSGDDLIAFVDGLPDDEVVHLQAVMLEPDLYPSPVFLTMWTKPPPWRFRVDGQIPPKIGGIYPGVSPVP